MSKQLKIHLDKPAGVSYNYGIELNNADDINKNYGIM
jgi:hypothetical protein